jgi:hypothetical protein
MKLIAGKKEKEGEAAREKRGYWGKVKLHSFVRGDWGEWNVHRSG